MAQPWPSLASSAKVDDSAGMSANLIALQNRFLGRGETIYDRLAQLKEEKGALADEDLLALAKETSLPPGARPIGGEILRRPRGRDAGEDDASRVQRRGLRGAGLGGLSRAARGVARGRRRSARRRGDLPRLLRAGTQRDPRRRRRASRVHPRGRRARARRGGALERRTRRRARARQRGDRARVGAGEGAARALREGARRPREGARGGRLRRAREGARGRARRRHRRGGGEQDPRPRRRRLPDRAQAPDGRRRGVEAGRQVRRGQRRRRRRGRVHRQGAPRAGAAHGARGDDPRGLRGRRLGGLCVPPRRVPARRRRLGERDPPSARGGDPRRERPRLRLRLRREARARSRRLHLRRGDVAPAQPRGACRRRSR